MSGPIARPTALSGPAENARTGAGSVQIRARTNGTPPDVHRVSASRLRQIASELSDQDWAVVRFIASTRLATGTQLARRLWASEDPSDAHARAARRALHRLEELKLIGRLGRRLGGVRAGSSSIVYRLESAGHRLLAPGRKKPIAASSYDTLAHTLAVTELLVQLHEHTAHGELEIASVQSEPGCWRRFPGPYGGLVTLKPDLFAVLAGPVHQDRYFIEVDLATESPARIRAKAKRYLEHLSTGTEQRAHGAYPRVVFTAPHIDRVAQLEAALGGLDPLAAKLFVVWQFDEVAGRMVAEATA